MDDKAAGSPSPASYGANAAAYGDDSGWGAGPQQSPPARGCTYSRQELEEKLKESDYGQNYRAYSAYFINDATGGHLCRTCNRPLGQHPAVVPAQVIEADADISTNQLLANLPPPDVGIHDIASLDPGSLTTNGMSPYGALRSCPVPRHWKDGTWFINYLEFDGFVGKQSMTHSSAQTRWRCVAPDADGSGPCGETFVTNGVTLSLPTFRPDKGSVANMTVAKRPPDAMMKHFEETHGLEHMPPGKWSTTLIGDYCQHPKAAISCCLFPMSCMPMCPDARGRGFCNALDVSGPSMVSNQATVAALSHDEVQCSCPCVCSCGASAIFLPHILMGMTFLWLGSVLTLCGIPCGEDFPVLLCCCCYARRRRFVKALGINESHAYSKCATFFCCPCSEVQQYRELRNSGVWAGLCCCTASDEDKAAMTPSAVRERYSVDGAYGVQAKSGAGHVAKRTASLIDTLPGPKIGWSME